MLTSSCGLGSAIDRKCTPWDLHSIVNSAVNPTIMTLNFLEINIWLTFLENEYSHSPLVVMWLMKMMFVLFRLASQPVLMALLRTMSCEYVCPFHLISEKAATVFSPLTARSVQVAGFRSFLISIGHNFFSSLTLGWVGSIIVAELLQPKKFAVCFAPAGEQRSSGSLETVVKCDSSILVSMDDKL